MIRRLACACEEAAYEAAASPWAMVALVVFSAWWVLIEGGNIGYDGLLTIVGVALALAILREQRRRDPDDPVS